MNAKERDELLIRLDERSQNTWRVVEQMEKHQAEQNGHIRQLFIDVSKNTTWRSVNKWAIGILVSMVLAIIGWISRLQGLW